MKTIITTTVLFFALAGMKTMQAQTFDFTTNFINDQIMEYNFMRKPVTIDREGNFEGLNGYENFNLLELDSGKRRVFYEWKGANGIYLYKKDLSGGVAPRRFQYEIEFSVKGRTEYPLIIMKDEEAALSTYNAFQHLLTLIN